MSECMCCDILKMKLGSFPAEFPHTCGASRAPKSMGTPCPECHYVHIPNSPGCPTPAPTETKAMSVDEAHVQIHKYSLTQCDVGGGCWLRALLLAVQQGERARLGKELAECEDHREMMDIVMDLVECDND